MVETDIKRVSVSISDRRSSSSNGCILEEEDSNQNRKSSIGTPMSLKNKFRKAVQRTSISISKKLGSKQKLSIFNIIISPEFGIAHQEERMQLAEKMEAGNQILNQYQQHNRKPPQRKQKIQYVVEDWMLQIANVS